MDRQQRAELAVSEESKMGSIGGWTRLGQRRHEMSNHLTGLLVLSFTSGCDAMLLVPLQETSEALQIIIVLVVFLFIMPVICKVLHMIRMQVNKIRNADIWGQAEEQYVDEDDDDEL
mmetsp:Transcript_11466/g.18053  ORF Transcript_11466/g.18053 Transcript_11466/m.18053 type:complete len:117 (-) Transcript_11466:690-1040(-)